MKKFVYWTPRVLSILFVLFLMLFSLDVFGNGLNFWQTALALLMHNIPALIILAIVLISWKYEIVGGIGFIFAGVLYVVWVLVKMLTNFPHPWYMLSWIVTIAGPAFLIGILFLIGWFKKRKILNRK